MSRFSVVVFFPLIMNHITVNNNCHYHTSSFHFLLASNVSCRSEGNHVKQLSVAVHHRVSFYDLKRESFAVWLCYPLAKRNVAYLYFFYREFGRPLDFMKIYDFSSTRTLSEEMWVKRLLFVIMRKSSKTTWQCEYNIVSHKKTISAHKVTQHFERIESQDIKWFLWCKRRWT